MRNLTIRRDKTFIACLAKMKVYIEDYTADDLVINGVPCRKLGDLKNGEEKTFVIDEREAKVFVIADKLSKGFNSDFCTIPAGIESIYLSGKNHYNPITGNPFRFDGVANEETVKNRKKSTRIGIVILVVAMLVGFVLGFLNGYLESSRPEEFTYNDLTITLTGDFDEYQFDGFSTVYANEDCAIFINEEDFGYFEETDVDSLEDYCQLIIDVNEFDESVKPQLRDNLMYFEYEATNEDNEVNRYMAFVYEGSDAYWLVQFAVSEEIAQEYEAQVFEWAKSVEIS